jgi:hypothetical protein
MGCQSPNQILSNTFRNEFDDSIINQLPHNTSLNRFLAHLQISGAHHMAPLFLNFDRVFIRNRV